MPEIKKTVIVTFPIFYDGIRRVPGDRLEITDVKANEMVAIGRATFDLKWAPPKKEPDEKPKK